jgi:hypothetical protein
MMCAWGGQMDEVEMKFFVFVSAARKRSMEHATIYALKNCPRHQTDAPRLSLWLFALLLLGSRFLL